MRFSTPGMKNYVIGDSDVRWTLLPRRRRSWIPRRKEALSQRSSFPQALYLLTAIRRPGASELVKAEEECYCFNRCGLLSPALVLCPSHYQSADLLYAHPYFLRSPSSTTVLACLYIHVQYSITIDQVNRIMQVLPWVLRLEPFCDHLWSTSSAAI